MKKFLIEMLVCPVCHQELHWNIETETPDQIERGEANCHHCGSSYPVIAGIGIFLTPDLPREDLWDEVDSQLALHLKSHPDLEKKLMDGPVEELSPTDQQFRAMVLDERGFFEEGKKVEEMALKNSYTVEYSACWDSQIEYVLDGLNSFEQPIVDLASGRCYLVEKIASRLNRQVVATDFSLKVLRRDREYFQFLGLDHLVSFLAFDARKTPFTSGAVEIMTTNVGLPNISGARDLMKELKRIVNGTFLGISHFFPPDDEVNREVIRGADIEAFMYKDLAREHFSSIGFNINIENCCSAKALPTPVSEILEGARADGLPVAPTNLEWCTLRVEKQMGC